MSRLLFLESDPLCEYTPVFSVILLLRCGRDCSFSCVGYSLNADHLIRMLWMCWNSAVIKLQSRKNQAEILPAFRYTQFSPERFQSHYRAICRLNVSCELIPIQKFVNHIRFIVQSPMFLSLFHTANRSSWVIKLFSWERTIATWVDGRLKITFAAAHFGKSACLLFSVVDNGTNEKNQCTRQVTEATKWSETKSNYLSWCLMHIAQVQRSNIEWKRVQNEKRAIRIVIALFLIRRLEYAHCI